MPAPMSGTIQWMSGRLVHAKMKRPICMIESAQLPPVKLKLGRTGGSRQPIKPGMSAPSGATYSPAAYFFITIGSTK